MIDRYYGGPKGPKTYFKNGSYQLSAYYGGPQGARSSTKMDLLLTMGVKRTHGTRTYFHLSATQWTE